MGKDIKVGDILRDEIEGDEWKVLDINDNIFYCQNIKYETKTFISYDILIKYFKLLSQSDNVNHPAHYGGENNPYEAIKVIEAWELNFCLGNAVKYISRAGKKDSSKTAEDLEKAIWYLNRELKKLKDADTK